jgi:tetratricopeptide (TPR) repeat protein
MVSRAAPFLRCHTSSSRPVVDGYGLVELLERVDAAVEHSRNKVNCERRNGTPLVGSLTQLISALDDKVCLRPLAQENDERIKLCREALSLAEQSLDGPLILARLSIMLARALGAIEDRTVLSIRDHSHLDERIALCRSALSAIPQDTAYYPEALSELAIALCQNPKPCDSQEAVALQAEVISHSHYNAHPLRIRLLSNAAACHLSLARISNSISTAQEAAALARRSLNVCPRTHVERYRICETATWALRVLSRLDRDASLISQSNVFNQECLDIAIRLDLHRSPIYDNFCIGYGTLFELTGDRDALKRCVEYGDLLVLYTPSDDKYRPMWVFYTTRAP